MIEASGYEEAARWFFRCGEPECTERELKEFEKWLEASPRHMIAFLHVEAAWREGSSRRISYFACDGLRARDSPIWGATSRKPPSRRSTRVLDNTI